VTKDFDECVKVALEALSQDFVSSPMETWSENQVEHWLTNMTRTAEKDIKRLTNAKVCGKVLCEMNPEKLQTKGFKIAKSLVLAQDIQNRVGKDN